MSDVVLDGCRTQPLIGYLKALGVLAALSEQEDSQATLRWQAGIAVIGSSLDVAELSAFLLDRWEPSPVVSPWNGGSGFHPKDNKAALTALESSASSRLAPYRDAVAVCRRVLADLGIVDKPEKRDKQALLRELRAQLPDRALPWIDASVVLGDEDRPDRFPPLLGSGGNDGRFDIAQNVAQCLVTLIGERSDRSRSGALLDGALYGLPVKLDDRSVGHFERDASPVNSPFGEHAVALANPWDLVLAIEGCLLFTAGLTRRYETSEGLLSAPFAVRAVGAGYGSAVGGEKGRAELWMPTWAKATSRAEIEALLREGRAQVGRRLARTGTDVARAAAELGVARGLDGFERYAILERAGQSSLAVAAGRIDVRERPAVSLLQPLDRWLNRLRDLDKPASLRDRARRLQDAVFAFALDPGREQATALLIALGEMERGIVISGNGPDGLVPLRRVPMIGWLELADDHSHEFAIAAGLASLRSARSDMPEQDLRDYLHGTERVKRQRSYKPARRIDLPREAGPLALLAAIHVHRHLDTARGGNVEDATHGGKAVPRPFERGLPVGLDTLDALAGSRVDLPRTLALARGLALLDPPAVHPPLMRKRPAAPPVPMLRPLLLAWHGVPDGDGDDSEPVRTSVVQAGWAAQLAAGSLEPVVRAAVLRLQIALRPAIAKPEDLLVNAPRAEALSAALLLTPSWGALRDAAKSALAPIKQQDDEGDMA